MKKITRKAIAQAFDSFKEIGEILERETLDVEVRNSALCDCQQLAISIGEGIEQDNSFSKCVKDLEEICEAAYRISDTSVNTEDERTEIQTFVSLIRLLLNDFKSVPYKVLFLPYQYAMWDSMKSIWEEAVKRTDVKAYVMPIPYCGRGSDGSTEKMKCDLELFPQNVDAIDWKNSNIREINPDIIFVHNPYDEYNRVSSVAPMFYSKELTNLTEYLVYVPYYFTLGKIPESHEILPAYKYVDFVVAQNREMAEQLQILPSKKLTLGSPKLDAIIKGDLSGIPREIVDKCRGKKVFFINLSISAVLRDDRQIELIDRLFETAEEQESYILIFRPHPLLEATLKAMRPQKVEEFHNLCNHSRISRSVILDEGMELEGVIALSDAYIGEKQSSIMPMFASLGKPIFSIDEENNHRIDFLKETPAFTNCCTIGEFVYFTCLYFPFLCKSNKERGIVEKIYRIPNCSMNETRPFGGMIAVDGKLILAPFRSSFITIFDTNEERFESIPLRNPQSENYNILVTFEDWLLGVPLVNDEFFVYDSANGTVDFESFGIDLLTQLMPEEGYKSFAGAAVNSGILYMVSPRGNYLIEYDLISGNKTQIDLCTNNKGFWGMVHDGNYLWLIPYKGKEVIRYNTLNGEKKVYIDYPAGFDCNLTEDLFVYGVDAGNAILLFPKIANMIVKIDKNSGEMSEFAVPSIEFHTDNCDAWPSKYYFAKREEEVIFAQRSIDNALLEMNVMSQNIISKTIHLSDGQIEEIRSELVFYKEEDDLINLFSGISDEGVPIFIQAVVENRIGIDSLKRSKVLSMFEHSDGTAGKAILDTVLGVKNE